MIRLLILMIAFVPALSVAASPSTTCAPSIQAQATDLYCPTDAAYVSIEISTLMSPSTCPQAERVEVSTAKVEITDRTPGASTKTWTLQHGEFSYTLSQIGNGTFVSIQAGLNFDHCFSPASGAFSVGN